MLSKSKIMRGMQCHKSMWLYKNRKDLLEISPAQQAVFETGTNVGVLAQQLFPGGADATTGFDWPNYETAKITKQLIEKGENVIYEATVVSHNTLVAVDILVKNNLGTWDAYEVKSTTQVKEPHFPDAAVQYFVLTQSGLEINSISIVHLNNQYVRQGVLAIQQLFSIVDITDDVQEWQEQMPDLITELDAIENKKYCPEIEIGQHCSDPYGCLFTSFCWQHIPEYSVFNLARGGERSWDLYAKGILEIKDIPFEYTMGDSARIQYESELTGEPFINKEAIGRFLNGIEYPVYHFDFETFMSAIPLFDNARPYQQIPFQYSIHKQETANGEAEHFEYLAETSAEQKDPREALIIQMLKDLGTEGSILAYHASFEITQIKALAQDFPQYADDLLTLNKRMIDLEAPFRSKYYYTKEMQGRSSIKKVLPALVPELSYGDLEVQEGGTAMAVFLAMFNGTFNGDVEQMRKNLLAYCERDTWAMVKLLEKLSQVA